MKNNVVLISRSLKVATPSKIIRSHAVDRNFGKFQTAPNVGIESAHEARHYESFATIEGICFGFFVVNLVFYFFKHTQHYSTKHDFISSKIPILKTVTSFAKTFAYFRFPAASLK